MRNLLLGSYCFSSALLLKITINSRLRRELLLVVSSFGHSSNYDYSSLLDNGCPEITVITVFEVETEQRPMFILQPQIFCALLRPVARPHRLAVCPVFGPLQNSEFGGSPYACRQWRNKLCNSYTPYILGLPL